MMEEQIAPLGQRIREAREARRWSQDHLAGRVGTTQQNIGRIESGKILFSRYHPRILATLELAVDTDDAAESGMDGIQDFQLVAWEDYCKAWTAHNQDPLNFTKAVAVGRAWAKWVITFDPSAKYIG